MFKIKKIVVSKLFLVCLVLFIIVSSQNQRKSEKEYEKYKCKTKKLKIKGVISEVNKKSNYMSVSVDNLDNMDEWISLNISEEKYKKGFSKYYSYEVGDSIIKEANSKEFIIKRDTCIAVYILDCDD